VDEATEQILADALRNPTKYGISGCALCRGNIAVTAIFKPTEAFGNRIGQPKGKRRLVVYGLCNQCSLRSDLADAVEREILKQMGAH
jgi:hypothetical protein